MDKLQSVLVLEVEGTNDSVPSVVHLAEWGERGRQKPWRLLKEFSPSNVKWAPALPLRPFITKSCYGISSSESSAFCSRIWSRVSCLVVCVIRKWYVGGARCCLNWYSHFMHTKGLMLRGVVTFPTSLCPSEVLRVAKGQKTASCYFYWSCWHYVIIAILENSQSISVPFTLKSFFPRQTMWTWQTGSMFCNGWAFSPTSKSLCPLFLLQSDVRCHIEMSSVSPEELEQSLVWTWRLSDLLSD